MKKALAVLLIGGFVATAYAGGRAFSESQALTRAAPAAATEGISMLRVQGFRVSVCATNGNTLSGTGSLQAWLYNPAADLWMRNPGLDLQVTASGVRCQVFPDFSVSTVAPASGEFRTVFATSAVTVSAGTTVDVRIDAYGNAL